MILTAECRQWHLRGLVCLPDMILHFDVSRKKSIAALEAAMVKDQMVFLVAQKDPDEEDPKQEDLYTAGAMAKVKQIVKMPENMVRVVAEGKFRAELDEVISVSPYLLTDVIIHDREEKVENENEAEAMRRVLEEIRSEIYRCRCQVWSGDHKTDGTGRGYC